MNLVRLDDVARQIRGVTYERNEATRTPSDDRVALLRAGNITEVGVDWSDLVFVPKSRVGPLQNLRPGDVLIAASSGSVDVVGKAASFDSLRDACFGAFCKVMRPDPSRVDLRYFRHYFQTPSYRRTVSSKAAGANINNLRSDDLDSLMIPLPPLDEQRRIAAILDHVEHLRAAHRRVSYLLGTLPDVLYMRSFGDPRATGVRSRSLTDVCHVHGGATPSKSDPLLWEGEVPWFSPKDIKRDDLFESQDHVSAQVVGRGLRLFPKDTVVMVVRGMILAHTLPVATLRTPATINQDLKAFLPTEPIPADFLAASIRVQRHHILAEVDTAAHGTKRLDARALEAIRIPSVTPAAMRSYLEGVERHRAQATRNDMQLSLLDTLFNSLQSRAFAGEL